MGPDEFISVTADLVRRLGSANAALVWARIEFVCRIDGWDRVEDEDGIWWVVSKPKLAQDIGLSERTVRTTLENLIKRGHVEAKMVDESAWDRSLAYRAVGNISAGGTHRTKKSDASDEKGRCIGQNRPIDRTKKSDVPYIEEVKKKNIIDADDALFEEWWKHYPRKVSKGQARKAYKTALKKTDHDILLAAVKAFSASVAETDTQFIAHASTWLNGERWLDEGITPADAASVTDWLRECWKQADTKSIEERSGMTYRPNDPPEDVDIREFLRRDRQQWITDNHDEIVRRVITKEASAA
ncbi:hypothetical protein [Rhodococcus pyridinivorans]